MIKRFLLHQKINKRLSLGYTRERIARRLHELLSASAQKLRTVALRLVHHKAFGYVASSLSLVVAALILALILSPKSASPVAKNTVDPSPLAQQVVEIGTTSLQKGSGIPFNRDKDIMHTVQDGETFSEIAYIYDVSIEKLALYNHIADVNRIKEGMVVTIPSFKAEKQLTLTTALQTFRLPATNNPAKRSVSSILLNIEAEQQFDGTAVTAHFSVKPPDGVELSRFEWNLGIDGRKSFRPNTFWTYDAPGTYAVSLKATDADGREYDAEDVLIDVPHPGTYQSTLQQFLTLESVEDTFPVHGTITKIICYDQKSDPPIAEVSSDAEGMIYKPTRPGYFSLEVEEDGAFHHYYVFVSPVDSKHSDRTDLNWYRTQFNTGTQSNCGPATASMGISWATGEYVAVSTVRKEIGWTGNGETSFEDLSDQMRDHHVNSRIVPISSSQDVFDIIDRGNIAIVLYNSGGPRYTRDPAQTLFGRYYFDAVGHYIVIKGYSKDRQYLVTYDPIPSDWGSNSFRYADGISMIGRNRYYGTLEIVRSLRRWEAIEVMR
jgi:hypothetical protein